MMYVFFFLLFPTHFARKDLGRHVLTLSRYDSFKIFMGLPTTGGGPQKEQK
jgi:hypothetical protein